MPADDADRLGPKGHVYVELVREQWRAPLERGTARRALLTSALGIALILFGLVGAFVVYGESVVLIGIGAFAFYSSLGEIRALMPEFREARRIGWVEPALDDGSVTIGEPATFRVVLHARRAQVQVEQAAADEPDLPGHARLLGVAVAFLDAHGVDVDPHRPHAVLAGGRDGDSPVAAAQVIQHIPMLNPGQLEHPPQDGLLRGHIRHIAFECPRRLGRRGGFGGSASHDRARGYENRRFKGTVHCLLGRGVPNCGAGFSLP